MGAMHMPTRKTLNCGAVPKIHATNSVKAQIIVNATENCMYNSREVLQEGLQSTSA